MSHFQRFFVGISFLFLGLKLLRQVPGLFLWAIVPLLIDLVLVMSFLGVGWSYISSWVTQALGFIFSTPSGWVYNLLYYPLYFLLAMSFIVLVVYAVFLLATVVASPFNSVLSEKVLVFLEAKKPEPFRFSTWLAISFRMLLVSLIRAVLFAVLGIFIFAMSFVPGLNVVASFVAFLIIVFDSADYSYEILEMGLRQRWRHFQAHWPEFSGMAFVMGLTLVIPGLTLLVLPVSVVGAAGVIAKSQRERINVRS